MRHPVRLGSFLAIMAAIHWSAANAAAEDAYFEIPVRELKITAGELPDVLKNNGASFRFDPRWSSVQPEAVLDAPAEGYLEVDRDLLWRSRIGGADYLAEARLRFKSPPGKEITGTLRLPTVNPQGLTSVKFSIPAGSIKAASAERFYRAKLAHYVALHQLPIAGTAWFNHKIREAERQLRTSGGIVVSREIPARAEPDTIYALFSGGRAISENLQLTRALRAASAGEPVVPIEQLEGITVAEINWKPLLKGLDPQLDPLAKYIPADQHAVFFPTFAAAIKLSDEAKGNNADLLRLAEPRSEDAETLEFYQRQLGLPLSVLARALGGKVVNSVALTGSDPYFRVGTDVAVVLECKNGVVVMAALLTQIQNSARNEKGVKAEHGEIDGVLYQSYQTPNRRLCSYVAQLGDAVVVTNSPAQLKKLVAVFKGKTSLAALDEYKFFRQRYPLGDADETAFVFLSDATIRRWCSPRWRIASARRTYAAGALAELTAEYAKDIGRGKVEPGALHTDLPLVGAGKLNLAAGGVESSTLGSVAWMTPISEMPIDKVTPDEARSYRIWRDNYQRNWRWAFDPIGLRICVGETKLAADLTVMPLIAGSQYRWAVDLSRGVKIPPGGADQHVALTQVALAINKKSEEYKWASNMLAFGMAMRGADTPRFDPLAWLGETISVSIDDDPIWEEAAKLPAAERDQFFQKNVGRLPVALYCDVVDPLRLTAFLAGVRAFIEPSAPGMVHWETFSYRDEAYVRVTPTRQGREAIPGDVGEVALYYAPSAESIVFSMSEATLKRAIDRRLARRAAKENDAGNAKDSGKEAGRVADADAKAANALPWLGENFCLQVDRRMFRIFSGSLFSAFDSPDAFQTLMQMRSWGNLPILNEWKRMLPDQDPVAVHEKLWKVKLICPGGGKYVWNDDWKTMESTVYGHPGEPKRGEETPAGLEQFGAANFGLTFEEQGLRARMELLREAK